MAARPIQINFTAKYDEVVEAGKASEQSLEDIRIKLTQLADESVTTWREMDEEQRKSYRAQFATAKEFSDDVKRLEEQQKDNRRRAYDTYERVAKETYNKIDDTAESSGKSVAKSAEDGFGKAEDSAKKVGTSAQEIASDIVSDFDGGWDSIASGGIRAVTRLADFIPGIGATVGGAIGGIAVGMYEQWNAEAERTEERISNMYDDMLASGLDYLSAEYVTKQLGELFKAETAESKASMREIGEAASLLGLSVEEVGVAWVTSGQQRSAVNSKTIDELAETKTKIEELQAVINANPEGSSIRNNAVIEKNELDIMVEGYDRILKKTSDLTGEQNKTLGTIRQARDAQGLYTSSLTESQKAAQGITDTVNALPSSKKFTLDVDTSAADAAISRFVAKPIRISAVLTTRDRFGKEVY